MKSRRLTIFCVAVIALAGMPRAWQEAGKLLAIMQHKAQVRFWSMVLQPEGKSPAGAETLVAATLPRNASSAEIAAACPVERSESPGYRISSKSQTDRRVASASFQAEAEARRLLAARAAVPSVGLTAKILKVQHENNNLERLLHSRNIPGIQPTVIAESRPAPQTLRALPHSPMSNGNSFSYVEIPMVSPAAVSSLAEKETVFQFKLLKKSFEDNKWIRQKVRFVGGKGVTAILPAS
jgi:hypothetical protein